MTTRAIQEKGRSHTGFNFRPLILNFVNHASFEHSTQQSSTSVTVTKLKKKRNKKMAKSKTVASDFEKSSLSKAKSSSKSGVGVHKLALKRDKSWLLLASELSLNSTENEDDVFS